MSNLKNSVKKGTLWSVIVVIVIAVGIVLGALLGFNASNTLKDSKTLTVTVDRYTYNTQLDSIEAECENAIGSLDVLHVLKSEMSGDECEIVYVFASDVDLTNVEKALDDAFVAKTADGAALAGSFINVSAASEKVEATLAEGYVVRAVIAVVVIAVLAFAYVAIRHSLGMGIAAAASALVGAGLTMAIAVFTRIPTTSSIAYAIAIGSLASLVVSLLTLNKVHANLNAEEPADETVAKSVPVAEIAWLSSIVAVAMLLVGVISIIGAGAFTVTAWFAVACIIAMAATAFVGIIYTPALYVTLKGSVDKKLGSNATSDYVGAKKTSTKVKKVFEKKEAEVEEKAEEPSCCGCNKCSCEEEVVETEEATEAEEVVEAEEVAEAEEVVETEEAVEEVAEEVAEEAAESEENND